ncbi:MAG: XRE family transcriptional regulator [Gammaproteobacteria bacterium BRH_c0]|nr:MAG: XRE family transcriptional regulator [Gammaproteobacteria bacterium BRH_c0]
MHILLIEDDKALAESLARALGVKGYVVNAVERGQHGLHALKTDAPDIIILDLGLPDMDGFTVLKRMREVNKELPVLLLTARDSMDAKVTGLDGGADDYLTKPFDMAELFARLRVLERRLSTTKTSAITIGPVALDTAQASVTFNGQALELSRREFMLLRVLMENAGKVLTRASLESRLYSWGEEVASNTVEVHVHHLRKKLGSDFIHTVRGVGYKVALP